LAAAAAADSEVSGNLNAMMARALATDRREVPGRRAAAWPRPPASGQPDSEPAAFKLPVKTHDVAAAKAIMALAWL
jgi:hypothetical protein